MLRSHLLCKAGTSPAAKAGKWILARPSTTWPERQGTQREPVLHSSSLLLHHHAPADDSSSSNAQQDALQRLADGLLHVVPVQANAFHAGFCSNPELQNAQPAELPANPVAPIK